MGLEKIGYIVLIAVTGAGAAGVAYAVRKRRPLTTGFALALLGLSGLFFWSVFVSGLKQTLMQAIDDGRYAQYNAELGRQFARSQQRPPPKVDETWARAIVAYHQAQRTARLFGWTEEELLAPYLGLGEEPTGRYMGGQPSAESKNR